MVVRSKTVIIFLRLEDDYKKEKKTRAGPKALWTRDEKRLLKLASIGKYSGKEILQMTVLKVCN